MRIDMPFAAKLISCHDNFLILTHAHPDADTLGSGFALCRALLSIGKKARVICADETPKNCLFMTEGLDMPEFSPEYIIAVDVADTKLLGSIGSKYSDKVNLCIDHHGSNRLYAEYTLLSSRAAAAEMIYLLLRFMNIGIDPIIASCLYAGIATDTGCFVYSNTTAETHSCAAALIESGADLGGINKIFFETKTKEFAALEKLALNNMQLHFGGLCAITVIMRADFEKCGANENDYERIPSLTRQIEGVVAGVGIRELANDSGFKLSLRTFEPVDAAQICKKMDGGGHSRAAGCTLHCSLDEACQTVLKYIEEELSSAGLIE